jgi:hypothetical protein
MPACFFNEGLKNLAKETLVIRYLFLTDPAVCYIDYIIENCHFNFLLFVIEAPLESRGVL